jgi:hypothetical protein
VGNVWWSCKQTGYVDMGNEETVENKETGGDDEADENEVKKCSCILEN